MSTATSSVVCDNSSLANFKSWAQFISNFFTTAGWTQTADTGQVNWGTIASVPSSTYVYEIWEAADAEAGTTPIFVKMEYGFTSAVIRIQVTVGTGSDGSGAITGATMGPYIITGNSGNIANQGGTAYPCYASGDAGEIRFIMWRSNATVALVFGIERSKDSSGAKTADYFTLMSASAQTTGASWVQQTILGSLVTVRESNFIGVGCDNVAGSENFNGTTAANPIFPMVGKLGNPMLGWAVAAAADVAEGASVTVAIYGANHTYLVTKTGSLTSLSRYSASGNQAMAVMMRYE